jgi:hypothetical protein
VSSETSWRRDGLSPTDEQRIAVEKFLTGRQLKIAAFAGGGENRHAKVCCGVEIILPWGLPRLKTKLATKAVHGFAALIMASAVAITPAQAQTASELRISGTPLRSLTATSSTSR